MILVVLLDEILDDGPGLPEREARVRVLDGRHAAVGVELEVGLLLHLGELDLLELVGDAQLLEDHADFDGVGPDAVAPECDGLERGVGRHRSWIERKNTSRCGSFFYFYFFRSGRRR